MHALSHTPARGPERITLLPYQKEAIDRARDSELFICEKSRRTGMTLAFAHEAVAIASGASEAGAPDDAGPMNVFYLSYNLDMTSEFMDDCARFADQALADGAGFSHKVTRRCISFGSGFSITALNSAPRSLRGRQGMVIVDEAAFVNNLPEVMKAAIALQMWGARIVILSTHNGIENPFAGLIDEVRMERRPGDVMTLTLNDALDQGLHKCISRTINRPWSQQGQDAWEQKLRANYGESASEELDVIPARAPATWIDRPTIEGAMTQLYKMIRLTLPPGLSEQSPADRTAWMERWIAEHVKPVIATFDREKPSYFGQDFARSNDLSVIMAGQYSDDSVLQCMLNIEMKGIYFELQKQLLRAICDAMPQFTAGFMDASGNGADIAEFMEGIFGKSHITCIKATEATYHAMMPRVKRRIEDQTIAMPRDEGVIYDLRMVRMKNGTPRVIDRNTTLINGTKSRRHGDTAIALMHLVGAADVAEHVGKVMAIRRGPLPYDGFVNGVP